MDSQAFAFRFKLGVGDLIVAYALVRRKSVPVYVLSTLALFVISLAVISFMRGGMDAATSTLSMILTGRADLMVYGLVAVLVVFAATSHWIFGALYALAVSFSPLMKHAVDARIDTDGISLTANGVASHIEWRSIVSVFANDAILVCRLWTGQLFILPRRFTTGSAEFAAVKALVSRNVRRREGTNGRKRSVLR